MINAHRAKLLQNITKKETKLTPQQQRESGTDAKVEPRRGSASRVPTPSAMPVCCVGIGSLGSLKDARKEATSALKKMQEFEKKRHDQHKKLRDLLSKHISTVSSLFEVMDVDRNGMISLSEFRDCMATLGDGFRFPTRIYDELFAEFDSDGSGEISYKEYFSYVLRDSLRRKATSFRDFFTQADASGDGTIDKHEFRRAVVALHGSGSGNNTNHEMELLAHSNEIDDVFDAMDVDGSGTLTLHELYKNLRCGVGMGKFMRRRKSGADSPDTVVKRTKSSSRLRGALSKQYLMSPWNATNAAFFENSLDHQPTYVERTAVARAAYDLVVDERFDKHLNSGARLQLANEGARYLPLEQLHSTAKYETHSPAFLRQLHSSYRSSQPYRSSRLEPSTASPSSRKPLSPSGDSPPRPFSTLSPHPLSGSPTPGTFGNLPPNAVLHPIAALPLAPSPPRHPLPPLYSLPFTHGASGAPLVSLSGSPPSSPMLPRGLSSPGSFMWPERSFAHLQPLPSFSPVAPIAPPSPWRQPLALHSPKQTMVRFYDSHTMDKFYEHPPHAPGTAERPAMT